MVDQESSTAEPPQARPRLFLLDGMALVYRSHLAMIRSPRYTSSGLCTSAVFGFSNTLTDLLQREDPTHIGVAFDTPEPTHRHEAYAEYKAHREAMPEDLSAQLPYVFRLLQAYRIPVIRLPGFEADDVLGTLARQAEGRGFETFLVTPDKDYHQLVSEHTRIWRPGRQGNSYEVLGIPEVLKQWDVERVDQVIDILGLMGDSSDNVPGVPGVGPKTAQKLIAEYGSLEYLLEHTSELKGKLKERLVENAELARLSKQLVTIDTNVPHDVEFEDLNREPVDREALMQLFVELEFESLGKRIFGSDFSTRPSAPTAQPTSDSGGRIRGLFDEDTEEKTLADVPHDYQIVSEPSQLAALLERVLQQSRVCLDFETTGLNARTVRPLGLAIAWEAQKAFYVVFPEDVDGRHAVFEQLRPFLEHEQIEKIGHNLKYDLTLLRWQGFRVRGPIFDSMLVHTMLEPEMKHGLDYLAQVYLGYRPIPTSDLIGPRGENQLNMADVPVERVAEYACEDVDVTLQISQKLRPLVDQQGMSDVCYRVECPLIPVLVDMEFEGIRLDADALNRYSIELAEDISRLRDQIFAAAGQSFNIDSPKQLGTILYDELRLEENPKKTPTGQYSTRESELLRLAPRHPIVRDVLDYRNAVKLKSVYVDQLPHTVNTETGRVHTHYSQTWTATGRMQSNDPNLQTIPVRKERGREIRAAFVPRDDSHLLLSADYSQIELRIMASLSQDEAMLDAFRANADIHSATAAKVYGVAIDEVTRPMRDKAKTVNFGIIYGISAFGLQQRLNIPRQEANDLIESYFAQYPGVKAYIDRTVEFGREHGYVETLTGRRRYLRDINSKNFSLRSAAERLAMNSPIQGTAADLLKLAMIRVHQRLDEGHFRTKMLLTVHDEIVFDMPKEEQSEVVPVIEDAMVHALDLNVPIVVEIGVGANWLEAH